MVSLRVAAKEMGISHSYLGMMIQGKRKWDPALFTRYQDIQNRPQLVDTQPSQSVHKNQLLDTSFLRNLAVNKHHVVHFRELAQGDFQEIGELLRDGEPNIIPILDRAS